LILCSSLLNAPLRGSFFCPFILFALLCLHEDLVCSPELPWSISTHYCPLLCYQEFYYRNQGFDLGFDPELQGACDWRSEARSHMKNAYLLNTLEAANWNVTPTGFQLSSFPSHWQGRISAIHDGIDSRRAAPMADLLTNRDRARSLAEKARETIQARYSLERCVPRQLALMDLVASGAICRLDPWAGSANQW